MAETLISNDASVFSKIFAFTPPIVFHHMIFGAFWYTTKHQIGTIGWITCWWVRIDSCGRRAKLNRGRQYEANEYQ
jgi:hypothetical protein